MKTSSAIFLPMIQGNSSQMTIPMNHWGFGPKMIVIPIMIILLSRKLYPAGRKPTSRHFSSPLDIVLHIDAEIQFETKVLS
jgi:hypothetical protein